MTDSEKFTLSEKFILIQKTKEDIRKLGFDIEINHGYEIKIDSHNLTAIWLCNGLFEVVNHKASGVSMNQIQWEDYAAEVDNLNRAIFWVNTQIKSIVFE